jgi:O-antigen/teichoic acid export membrane protein
MFDLLKSREYKNALWLISGKVTQMLLSLIVSILTARYLGPGNFGLINYGTAYTTFFAALCGLGINSVIIKDFVDHPDEQGEAIGSALLLRLISSMLSVIIIFGIVSMIDRDEPLTIVVVSLCGVGSIFRVFDTFNYWFQNRYRAKITSIATLVAYIATSTYRIILLVCEQDVCWFALATTVDHIVIAVFLYAAYKKEGGPKLRFSFKKAKSLLSVSYHYILSTMMLVVYGQTDKLMLKQYLGETEVGYYATAISICSMWTFILQALIDSLYPTILQLNSTNQAAFDRKNRQLYAIVFYLSCFVSIGFTIFGDWGISLLYGAEYAPAGLPLKIITWYTAFSYLGVARNAWIVSAGKQRYLKYMYFSAAIINIILNCIFIPVLGAAGAAIASLITQVLTSLLLPSLIKEMRPNVKLMVDAILLRNVF